MTATSETEEKARTDLRTAHEQEDIGTTRCDGLTLASDPPYPWGTGRAELPDPEVLGTGTNPEGLLGEDGQKRDSALRPGRTGGGARDERNAEGDDSNIRNGGEYEDGPVDGARAGRHRDHQSRSEGGED
ncbi:hypothetical protein NDU88_001973 [Pleurodeles waltl]|uniref:Uncharacterized protein n=1 Tax=Pleurodeles waltl TaxID=8319 RepID=A0AAV7Q7F9_PLEWA|nr:hypothetical protein NDU88_001973 [Pleurodeles waltl]